MSLPSAKTAPSWAPSLATLSLALASGLAFPGTTLAAEPCTQMFVYAVTPFCRVLPSGLSQCQPIGTVGPAPGCRVPGAPPLAQVPMGPPAMLAPGQASTLPRLIYPATVPTTAFRGFPGITQPAIPGTAPTPAAATPAPTPAVAQPPAASAVNTSEAPPAEKVPPMPVADTAPATPTVPNPFADALTQVHATEPAPVAVPLPAQPSAPAPAEDATAHFAFDSDELTAAGRADLDAWLALAPRDATVRITGHADRFGSASYNKDLSRRRAEHVKQYLIAQGMEASRLEVAAAGESTPVKRCPGGLSEKTIACLAPNRRVDIDPK